MDDESRVTLGERFEPQATPVTAGRSIAARCALPQAQRTLPLVLISAAGFGGLAGCGNLESNERVNRDVYANMEACKADWGNPGD